MANHEKRKFLLAYDIADKRRLTRVHRYMVQHGSALQKSVFICEMTDAEQRGLMSGLRDLIDEKADDVRCYGLHPDQPILFWGKDTLPEGILWLDAAGQPLL
jgi:CRISPR-associated protein Cas2